MRKKAVRISHVVLAGLLCLGSVPGLLAQDETVNGNLDVAGTIEFGANARLFSTAGDNFTLRTDSNSPNPNLVIGIGDGTGGLADVPIMWNHMLILNGAGRSWCPSCGVPVDADHRADMVINSAGNVGIGTTNPQNRLDVGGSSGAIISFGTMSTALNAGTPNAGHSEIGSTWDDNFFVRTFDDGPNPNFSIGVGDGAGGWKHVPIMWNGMLILNGSGRSWCPSCGVPVDADHRADMVINSAGNVGIGTTSPTNILTVAQNSTTDPIADCWTVYSSRRWKKDIHPIQDALEKVSRLRGVSFRWKETGKEDIGVIAEEVAEVVPEAVSFAKDGEIQGVSDHQLVAILIEAVKDQERRIREQESRIDSLERAIGARRAEINSLHHQQAGDVAAPAVGLRDLERLPSARDGAVAHVAAVSVSPGP